MILLISGKAKIWDFCISPENNHFSILGSLFISFSAELLTGKTKRHFTLFVVMVYATAMIHEKKRFAVFCISPKKVYFKYWHFVANRQK
jgi:hypothetical protein